MDAKARLALLFLALAGVTANDAYAESPAPPTAPVITSRSPDLGTGLFRGRVVDFAIVDGRAVVEGDIVLGRAAELTRALAEIGSAARTTKSLSIIDPDYLWPKGLGGAFEVPYTIDADPRGAVPGVVSTFNSTFAGFIRFVPRSTQADYVAFVLNLSSTTGCSSDLGRVGGKQTIDGPPGCSSGSLLHEMGHAIGLLHEQSRADRDQYVSYQSQNSAKYASSQSHIEPTDRQPLTPYDYGSLMHYDDFAFSRNGRPTHVTIPQGIEIGQRVGFSETDIDGVRRLYGAAPQAVTVTSHPAGLRVVVDGLAVTTPQTFSWPLNSVHQIDVVQPGQLLNGASYGFARWNVDLAGDGAANRTITVMPGHGSAGNPAQAPAVTVYTVNFVLLLPVTVSASGDTAGAAAATTASVNPPPQPYPGLAGTFLRSNQLVTLEAQVQPGFTFGGWFFDFLFFVTDGPATPSWLVRMPGAQNAATGVSADARGVANPLLRIRGRGNDGVVDGFAIKVNSVAKTTPYSSIYSVFNRIGANQIEAVSEVTNAATTRYRFADWDGAPANPISVTLPAGGQPSREITANFTAEYLVTVTPASTCRGTVTVTPASADGFHPFGQSLSVTAVPASGWSFAGWTDDLAGAGAQASVVVNGEVFAGARFNRVSEPLAISGASRLFTVVGEPAFDLVVYGTGFTPSTRIFANHTLRGNAVYVDANRMRVPLSPADFASPGETALTAANYDAALQCAAAAFASVPVRAAGFTMPATTAVVEFYHAALDHYFITANVEEMAKLDNGTFKGWSRTGKQFKGFVADSAALLLDIARTVCRFYGNPAAGLDSHFYSGAVDECDAVKRKFPDAWIFESSDVFQSVVPDRVTGACPDGTVPVYRLFNQRADANHRYTTDLAVRAQMIARGYVPEGYGPLGVALCSPA